jgi:putative salt-induced outer membrane protein YdiY
MFKTLNKLRTGVALLLAMGAGALVAPAFGAEVELESGEKISGYVLSQTPEFTIVKHNILGELKINTKNIKGIKFADGEHIGEPIPGSADSPTSAKVVVPDAAGGSTPTATAPTTATAPAPAPEVDEEKFSVTPKWLRAILKEWKTQIELGASGQSYVQNTSNFRFAFNTVRDTKDNLTKIDFSYVWGQTDGTNTKNEATTGIRNDFNLNEKWYIFALGRYDYNQFGDWNHRLSARTGPGYWFIKEEKFKLNGEVGFGAYKQFNSPNEDITPEMSIGGALEWKITKNQKFTGSTAVLPEFRVIGRYRVVSAAEYSVALSDVENLLFKVGLTNEYTSFVLSPDGVRNNLNYYAALVIGF